MLIFMFYFIKVLHASVCLHNYFLFISLYKQLDIHLLLLFGDHDFNLNIEGVIQKVVLVLKRSRHYFVVLCYFCFVFW